MAFKMPLINDLVLYPLKVMADYVYRAADRICAVSDTYLQRALRVNNKCNKVYRVLGTDLAEFDKNSRNFRGNLVKEYPLGTVGR